MKIFYASLIVIFSTQVFGMEHKKEDGGGYADVLEEFRKQLPKDKNPKPKKEGSPSKREEKLDYRSPIAEELTKLDSEYFKEISKTIMTLFDALFQARQVLEQVWDDREIFEQVVKAIKIDKGKKTKKRKLNQFKEMLLSELERLFAQSRGSRKYDKEYFEKRYKIDNEHNNTLSALYDAISRDYELPNSDAVHKMRSSLSNVHHLLFRALTSVSVIRENETILAFIEEVEGKGFHTGKFYELCELIQEQFNIPRVTDIPAVAAAIINVFLTEKAFLSFMDESVGFAMKMRAIFLPEGNNREQEILRKLGQFKIVYFGPSLEEVRAGNNCKVTESEDSNILYARNIQRVFHLTVFIESFVKTGKALSECDQDGKLKEAGVFARINAIVKRMELTAMSANSGH